MISLHFVFYVFFVVLLFRTSLVNLELSRAIASHPTVNCQSANQ